MLPSIPYDVPDINMKLPRLDTSLANYVLLYSFFMLRVSLVHVFFSIHPLLHTIIEYFKCVFTGNFLFLCFTGHLIAFSF